jgi:hypothetical protein
VPPAVAVALRDAALDAFDRLVGLAVERGVAFAVFAGGITGAGPADLRSRVRLGQGFDRLRAAGIPVCVALGPSDPRDGWRTPRAWPANVTIFPDGAPVTVAIERDGKRIATVHGRSLPPGTQIDAVRGGKDAAAGFGRTAADGIQVGVLPWSPASLDEIHPDLAASLRRASFDYWALGGRLTQGILASPNPWIVVPGTPQGRGPLPGEIGEKGALLVTVRGAGIHRPELVPLDVVRFVEIEVDAARARDLAELGEELTARAERLRARYPGHGIVARGVVTGDGPTARMRRQPGAIAGLLETLREGAGALAPFLWWAALVDDGPSRQDLTALRERADLAGELVRVVDEITADGERQAQLLASASGPLEDERLHEWVEPEAVTAERILRAATVLALDVIEEAVG